MATDDPLIRTLLLVIVAILLLPVLMMAFAMPMMGVWGGHMWNGGAWGGTGATWMWVLMAAIPLLVVLGLGYLLYGAFRRSSGQRTDPALEELRAAYARGDLTDEEFERRRERLQREESSEE
ncbi:SHOCT domain-containing protein [Halopiger aswanensis]|uniref:Putative membrane protein n=1 Tax=Halopiger aswanensis TaxID=148449 RepID=A0A419W0L6_9EURY|nr:SHOCT domain-containing protein [Halopiger aswanensis]RKD89016.1 putative membrane protein [Halopiger aswanensis]